MAKLVASSGCGGSKPGERRGGRQKGTPNKISGALKEMILGALADAGGQAYLVEQARQSPTAFLTLIGKVLPTTLAGDAASEPLKIEMVTRYVCVEPVSE